MELPVKATRATKMLGFDADGDPIMSASTVDEIDGAVDIISSSTTSLTNVVSIAALKLLGSAIDDNDSITVLGYTAEGDGGGGTFYWDASSIEDDNGGTIIEATGVTTGRWKKVSTNTTFIDEGTSANISIPFALTGLNARFKVMMLNNSDRGMTLNSLPIKVLDIHATEDSQYTFDYTTYPPTAAKDQSKTRVYRIISLNMLSADIEYTFIHRGSFVEVVVPKLYKHTFIQCGYGRDITELQDAFNYSSQFDCGTGMDPFFMNVDTSSGFYPNKVQISITLPTSTDGTPVTSTFAKNVRIGENNLSHLEVINDDRYTDTRTYTAPEYCIAHFTTEPNIDDLACFNIWKSSMQEVRGITFKYTGDMNKDNQTIVRYSRSEARFKDCTIDVSGATVDGDAYNIAAFYGDRDVEMYGCKVICNTTEQNLAAYSFHSTRSNVVGPIVEGKAKYILNIKGDITISNLVANDGCSYLADQTGGTHLTLSGSSTDISNTTNLIDSAGYPFELTTFSNITWNTSWDDYKNKTVLIGEIYKISSTGDNQLTVDSSNSSGAKIILEEGGVARAGIGGYASITGLELSGDETNRHMRVTTSGHIEAGSDNSYSMGTAGKRWSEVYAVNGTINTSDARLKTEVRELEASENRAALNLKNAIRLFKFTDAKNSKGEGARLHTGILAQEVKTIFEAEGLDAAKYGLFCYDEWEDEDGLNGVKSQEAGNRYGIRYEELLCFIVGAM